MHWHCWPSCEGEGGRERGREGGEGQRERGVGIQFPTKRWLQGSNGPELRSVDRRKKSRVSEFCSSCSIMTPQKMPLPLSYEAP